MVEATLKSGLQQVRGWFEENLPAAVALVEGLADVFRNVLIPATEAIVKFIADHWPEIHAVINFVMTAVQNRLEFIFGTILDLFQLSQAILMGRWGEAWEEIKSLALRPFDLLKSELENIWNLIDALFGEKLGALITKVSETFTEMKDKALEKLSELKTKIGELGADFFTTALGIGKQLVMGIGAGINSLKGWLIDQAKSIGESVFNAVKEGMGKLWPFSPSEAGVDVGVGLMEGMQAGVAAGLPALEAQMRAVASAVMAALSGASGQSPGATSQELAGHALYAALGGLQSESGGPTDALGAFQNLSGSYQDRIADIFGRGEDFYTVLGEFIQLLREMGFKLLEDWSIVPLSFAHGGTVPGPIGQSQLAVVEGGEEIIPVGQAGGEGGGGRVVNENVYIENVNVSGDPKEMLAGLGLALGAA